LSESFPLENGQQQGNALSSLHLNFASDYAIRKVQENQRDPEVNELRQLLACAYGDNLREAT
jgi:hypothetical protein